jgi:GNAT superfamily N-acetyltransferase
MRLPHDWESKKDGDESPYRVARLGTVRRSEQHWLKHGYSYEVATDSDEVETVMQQWREAYEYSEDTRHQRTHFIHDCLGSRALDECAARGGATCVIWLLDERGERIGMAGAMVKEGGPLRDNFTRRAGRTVCRLERIYVVPPRRGRGVGATLLSSLVCAVQLLRLSRGLGMCTHFGLGVGLRAQQHSHFMWVRLGWPVSQPDEDSLPDHEIEVQALLAQLPRQVFTKDQDVFPSPRDWSMKRAVSTQLTAITV